MKADIYNVNTVFGKIKKRSLTAEVPGSKSMTNRALLLATLANGESLLKGALFSDDSRYFLKCIQDLGFDAVADEEKKTVRVCGLGGRIPRPEAGIYVGSAGTAARFLTAYLGTAEGSYYLDASEQMRGRPMAPLLKTLEELGTQITYEGEPGYFPFHLESHGFGKHKISVDIGHSSQFMSAFLISACLAGEDMEIQVEGSHGMSYIHMTVKMMEEFGVRCEKLCGERYIIRKGQEYSAGEYQIEPDASAAAYFYAMAPLLGIRVQVKNVKESSLQGDVKFIRILEQMGCRMGETAEGIWLEGPEDGKFHGITVDMNACSDQAITLAAIAPFADSPTVINGIGHTRFQESNRIMAIGTELRRMGIHCEERQDGITIYPGEPRPAEIETYDDHRMAMGFTLTGLRAEGIVIKNPGCCSKTFEDYFQVLDRVVGEL